MALIPEIDFIEKKISELGDKVRSQVLATVSAQGKSAPIYKISFGSADPQAPSLGIIGGVHGLERIGSQVSLALLNSLSELVLWDQNVQKALETMRIYFIPVVNPLGIYFRTRSNARGVDLMRNAPVEASGELPFLVSGHRISPLLPWYRGQAENLEIESEALMRAVQEESFQSTASITLDIHSGFGFQDQIWFPFAKNTKPFPSLPEMHSFKELLGRTYPHHFYKIEPQAYSTHGDIWDYLYEKHFAQQTAPEIFAKHPGQSTSHQQKFFLPLCLEMGSWNWVKKNPLQFFSLLGPFNPVKQHRYQRTLRRHNTLFEFLMRAVQAPQAWAHLSQEQRLKHHQQALELWYQEKK